MLANRKRKTEAQMTTRFAAVLMGCFAMSVLGRTAEAFPAPEPFGPVPTPEQRAWQNLEYGMFCHFGINTFHNMEWTDGTKPPESFLPTEFNGRQWVEVAKEVGMNYLVVTAKHHDGFATFPTEHTDYGVVSSPWRDGQGDVVREVADACHELGVMFGFYLSPWDRHEPQYEDCPAYDEYFKTLLREVITKYGPVGEVWFDGAGTEGHVYDWDGYYALIRELAPGALIAICGPDIRWVGNEEGVAPETLWNVQERDGRPVWYPAECDVPIRKGQWFFHTNSEDHLLSLDELTDIYYKSVGRGAVLLLNVSPDRRGLLPDADAARLRELWRLVTTTFKTNLAAGKPSDASNVRGQDLHFGPANALDGDPKTYWATNDAVTEALLVVDLEAPTRFDRAMIQEFIALGQRVEEYAIEAWDGQAWKEVVSGTTIGHKRLDRFPAVTTDKVRLVIRKARACPVIQEFGLYEAPQR
jgi:alpha-L-fucosidase